MRINTFNNVNKLTLKGKIIAFPTDTVYGIGALIDDEVAIKKIYNLKKRNLNKPLAVLAASIDDILPYVEEIRLDVKILMEKYWPGALTIIFKKSAKTLPSVTCGLDTIGFRIPNDETALEILKKVGPIATTSINISGQPPLNDYHEIEKEFGDEIDYLFEKEVKSSNVSSTVIDCTNEDIKVLRQGEIIIK